MLCILLSYIVPSGSPQVFNATILSPYSADLTWAPPSLEEQNGVIIGYVINITILENRMNFLLYSNTTSLTVTSLRPYRNYICIIAAVTSIGIGPYSTTVTVTTPQDGKTIINNLCC